jgi:hypothetical protein
LQESYHRELNFLTLISHGHFAVASLPIIVAALAYSAARDETPKARLGADRPTTRAYARVPRVRPR